MACAIWSKTAVKWSDANWLWSMCGPCAVWGQTQVMWSEANWLWSMCNSGTTPPTPPIPPVVVSVGNRPGIDATTAIQPWLEEPWNPYRAGEREDNRKRWIKLSCTVNGKEYTEEKKAKDYKVTVDDMMMIINTIKNIDLKVKE